MHWINLRGIKGFYEGYNEEDCSFKFGGIVWNMITKKYYSNRFMFDGIKYGNQKKEFKLSFKEKVIIEEAREVSLFNYKNFSGWLLRRDKDNKVLLIIGNNYFNDNSHNIIFKSYSY